MKSRIDVSFPSGLRLDDAECLFDERLKQQTINNIVTKNQNTNDV